MEPFTYMYHGTDWKNEIVRTGYLFPKSYFCCTLYNGVTPFSSPFGDDILYVRAKDVLALFKDPRLYLDRSEPQDRGDRVNIYNTLYLTEGPRGMGRQLNIKHNEYLVLRKNGDCKVMVRDLYETDEDGRGIYYWTTIMVEKKIPLGELEHFWK